MSTAANFWAAKSQKVTSPGKSPRRTSAPTTFTVFPKTPEKNGTLANGSPPVSQSRSTSGPFSVAAKGTKKTDWADSDDENHFLPLLPPSGQVHLEKTVIAKDTRITELINSLEEKNSRITELESMIESQKGLIAVAQNIAEVSVARAEELETENHKQSLHVQKLLAEIDEKDRKIAALENEIETHCATIASLTQVSMDDISEDIQDQNTDSPTPEETNVTEGVVQNNDVEPAMQHAQGTIEHVSGVNTSPATPVTTEPAEIAAPTAPTTPTAPAEQAGPAVNDLEFPVFATAATVKQVPAPPPAPKLKMAVDMSKFGKKPAPTIKIPKKQTSTAVTAPVAGAKNGPAPTIDPSADIRTKRRDERMLFANGPKVQVKMDDNVLATLPKYVLMQCSEKAFKHFTATPTATSFDLPADSMDTTAAIAHLTWMKDMTFQGCVYSIPLHANESFDDKNLQICRASRVLGLNNMYVGHFTRTFCDRIRSNNSSYDFVSKVAALAYSENDPIYDCLTNNLATQRLHGTCKKPAEVQALLEKHAGLKSDVEKGEARIRLKQQGRTKMLEGEKGKLKKGQQGEKGEKGGQVAKGQNGEKDQDGKKTEDAKKKGNGQKPQKGQKADKSGKTVQGSKKVDV